MDVSLPTIDRWVREGCPALQRGGRGIEWKFNLPDVIAWWGEKQRLAAAGDSGGDIEEARRRKMTAEAALAELELSKAKGEVAPLREFERGHNKLMAIIRTNVMNVPSRAVLQLLGETDETVFKTRLRAELTLALEQSSEAELELDDEDTDG